MDKPTYENLIIDNALGASGPDYHTMAGLRRHPLFNILTGKQQRFVSRFIATNGDRIAAIQTTYSRALDEEAAEKAAVRILRIVNVRKLLTIYYGYDEELSPLTKGELGQLIAARLRKKELTDLNFNKLCDLLMDLRRWRPGDRPSDGVKREDHEDLVQDDVGVLVKQLEASRRKEKP